MTDIKPSLGFIGLGLMGSAMAQRLFDDGYRLTVWNLEPDRAEAFAKQGATVAATPAEVALASDIVLLCVLDTAAVESVVFGPSGVSGAARAGAVLVDHSTANPLPTADMAARLLAERGVNWIDAPVSGGPSFARERQLTIMAGGEAAIFARIEPVLRSYARNLTLMGPPGAGQMAKVINQAISGTSHVLMAEVLRLAEASGIDAARIPQCLAGGHADSTMLHFASAHAGPRLRAAAQPQPANAQGPAQCRGRGGAPGARSAADRRRDSALPGICRCRRGACGYILRLSSLRSRGLAPMASHSSAERRAPLRIVDAHHHFWDVERNYLPWLRDAPIRFRYGDYSALRRNYLAEDYRRDNGRYEVVASVYVEAEWDPRDPLGEIDWVSEVSRVHGLPSVAVGQAWLDRDDVETVLAALGQNPMLRGVRHKPRAVDSPDGVASGRPGSMGDPAWRGGYARLAAYGLSFDLQTPWWHLAEARRLADDFPDTRIVLNHAGLPADRTEEGLAGWRAAMRMLAGAANVAVKISGLGLPDQPWSVTANRPIVLDTIDIFGVERCMFASNFPVDSLVGTFETIMSGFDAITADFTDTERTALFAGNAIRYYRIPEVATGLRDAGGEEAVTER